MAPRWSGRLLWKNMLSGRLSATYQSETLRLLHRLLFFDLVKVEKTAWLQLKFNTYRRSHENLRYLRAKTFRKMAKSVS